MKVDGYIPPDYITNEFQKLDVYKRIADIETVAEKDDMLDELIDRFGEPPRSVCNLLDIALLKVKAHETFITSIAEKPNGIRIVMYQNAEVMPEKIPALIGAYGKKLRFVPDAVPYFVYQPAENEDILMQLDSVVEGIRQIKIPKGEPENEE